MRRAFWNQSSRTISTALLVAPGFRFSTTTTAATPAATTSQPVRLTGASPQSTLHPVLRDPAHSTTPLPSSSRRSRSRRRSGAPAAPLRRLARADSALAAQTRTSSESAYLREESTRPERSRTWLVPRPAGEGPARTAPTPNDESSSSSDPAPEQPQRATIAGGAHLTSRLRDPRFTCAPSTERD